MADIIHWPTQLPFQSPSPISQNLNFTRMTMHPSLGDESWPSHSPLLDTHIPVLPYSQLPSSDHGDVRKLFLGAIGKTFLSRA